MRRISIVAVALSLFLSAFASADTIISGNINADTTWTLAGSPYIVTVGVAVVTAKTLTIDPGVVVKFDSGRSLSVQGTLSAVGTAESPITFTSSAVSPARGAWGPLDFQGGTNPASQLSYATVSYGGAVNGGAIRIVNGTANFDHVTVTESSQVGILSNATNAITLSSITVSNCTSDGLRLDWGSGTLVGVHTITDSTFASNGGYGINLMRDAHVSISNATFTNNSGYAMGAQPGTAIDVLTNITATGNGSGTKNALEYRGGSIGARDETWRFSALPWVLTGGVTVGTGRTVTIEAGSTIKFGSGVSLTVQGRLTAVGTSPNPITFTSNAATPARGSWGLIDFQGGTNPASQLSYATVSYGGAFNGAAIRVLNGTANFDHVTVTESSQAGILSSTPNAITLSSITVSNCTSDGLRLDWGTGTLMGVHTITDSTFASNGGYGINLMRDAHASVSNATFTNNTGYAMGAQPGTAIDVLTNITATGNGSGTKNALEYRSGSITARDETWRFSALPWVLSGTTVGTGRTLTIEPGSTIKFGSAAILTVQGRLTAVGTSPSPITFTSSAATPTRGSWGMIDFQGGANPASQISYATVSYSGNNGYAIQIVSGTLNLDHVTVTESRTVGIFSSATNPITLSAITVSNGGGDGLQLDSGLTSLMGLHTVSDSTFTSNGGYGINLQRQGHASITNTSITNNTGYAIGAQPGTAIDALSGITATGNGSGAKNALEYRYGTVSAREETWRASALPWVLPGGSTIASGRTVTIEAGSTLKFGSGAILTVQGTLSAIGTSGNPITFTSSAATPTRGSWGMVDFQGGANPASQVSYASVSYSGNNGYAVRVASGALNLDHVTVTESSTTGISSQTAGPVNATFLTVNNCTSHGMSIAPSTTAGVHTISDATFANNGGWGLNVGSNGAATVHQAAFTGNTSGGLTSTNMLIDATMCYWGHATGPSGSGFGSGQAVNANVKFEPWLASVPTTAQRFTAYSISNRIFNPAIASTTTVGGTTNNAGTWTLIISNAANTVLRTFTGSGATPSASWDGKDESGVSQPNGNYTYELQSTNGTDVAAALRGRTIIDTNRQLTLTGFGGTPAVFSPNGDAVQDTTNVAGAVNYDDDAWALQIKDSGGAVVRSTSGSGQVAFVWDGRNAGGAMQPDGVYTAEVVVTEGTASVSGIGNVTIDTTAPVSVLSAPSSSQTISNVYQNGSTDFSVIGTISDANLANWTLDYSSVSTPTTWITINTGTSPVANAQVGVWHTSGLTNGGFNVRLRVFDQGGTVTTTTVTPTVGNFKATQSAYQLSSATGGTVTYTSTVPFTLTEVLTIKNQNGAVVRTLVNAQRAAGTYADSWNGTNDSSAIVPDGAYSYTVTATDGSSSMVWDTSSLMRGTSVTSLEPSPPPLFDPFNNKPRVSTYTLTDAYRVTVEVGPAGFAYGPDCAAILQQFGTKCLDPWHYEASGTHRVSWWGTDTDGSFLQGAVGLTIVFRQDNFPQNVVVTYGTAPSISNERVDPSLFNPGASTPALNSPSAGTQTISFTLGTYQNQPATVTVRVVNQANLSTLRTVTLTGQSPGPVSVVWDGRADNGMWVAEGYYTLIVSVSDAIGNITTQHVLTTIRY